jgi:acetolactate synthase regulatory subunit
MEAMIEFNKYTDDDGLSLTDELTPAGTPFAKKHTPESIEEDELTAIRASIHANYDMGEPNSARAVREAQENGLVVVYPESNQLQIDIDSDRAFNIFLEMQHLLEKYFEVGKVKITASRSGLPKRHITITLDQPITNYQRLALQVMMGSDRVREFLGYIQEKQGDPTPILFIEKP